MDRNLIEYLPEFMREFKEMQYICKAEQIQCSALLNIINQLWENQFIETADEETISRWEKILGIHSLDTDSLEDRKFRLLKSIKLRFPYTNKVLDEYLTEICGKDNFSIEFFESELVLKVRIALSRKNQKNAVNEWLKKIIPANLLLDFSVLYNTHEDIKKYTHEALSKYSHLEIREKENI